MLAVGHPIEYLMSGNGSLYALWEREIIKAQGLKKPLRLQGLFTRLLLAAAVFAAWAWAAVGAWAALSAHDRRVQLSVASHEPSPPSFRIGANRKPITQHPP